MLHSILITNAQQKDRLETAKLYSKSDLKPNPDLLILSPDPSIGIKDVRLLENFLSKKPYQNDKKIVLINQAHKLTIPAQNALLKTLEEPPANSQIFLLAPQDNQLLPTIISRCHIITLKKDIKLTKKEFENQEKIFENIAKNSLGEKINLVSFYAKSKDEALNFCENQTLYLRQLMLKNRQLKTAQLIKKLLQTQKYLHSNVNPKLCLESLFFSYKSS